MKEYNIHFLPDDISVTINEGQTILDAAHKCGIAINSSCGGTGHCNKCLVIPSGFESPVKACNFIPEGDLEINIPETSRHRNIKVMTSGINLNDKLGSIPELEQVNIHILPPDINDLRSDSKRVTDAINSILDTPGHDFNLSIPLVKSLPTILRNHIYNNSSSPNSIAIVNSNNTVIGLKPYSDNSQIYGIGIDFGTTTIVAALVNLKSGEILGHSSIGNPQSIHGDDVISRINYTCEHKDGLDVLNGLAIKAINDLAGDLADRFNIILHDIYEITVAGNATMQHILAGVPAEQIAHSPYVAAFSESVSIQAEQVGLNINPCGYMIISPAVAGHIGGDTVAVVLAAEMEYDSGVSLAVDIGTNGEIVLAHDGQIYCCSTAAGPAFEGAKIEFGMRGASGAIEKINYENNKVKIEIIDNCKAKGICGSGLIDILACLLNYGIIDKTGRLLTKEDAPESSPEALTERLTEYNNQPAFLLVPKSENDCTQDILLTQRDIRETQLGKAAIAAGIETLLAVANLSTSDIDRVYLAGAFGNYLHPDSALRVGLFPNVDKDKIISIGNAAGAGAIMMLTNKSLRQYASDLAEIMEYVELAGRPEFQMLFADKMLF